jgi:hypothetical protein
LDKPSVQGLRQQVVMTYKGGVYTSPFSL